MDAASVPEAIRTINHQAGVLELRGDFAYIGAQQFRYRCARAQGEYRSGYRSRLPSEGGPPRVAFDVGLHLLVNGKRDHKWAMVIAYEPDDIHSVWLVKGHAGRKPESMLIACVRDVYCDTLQSVIEESYDRAIAEHNQGFITLG